MAHLSPPPSPHPQYKFANMEHIKMEDNHTTPSLLQRSAFAAELGHKWSTNGNIYNLKKPTHFYY